VNNPKNKLYVVILLIMSILIGGYRTLAAKATEQWLKRGG